jgi:hypothetical protein
MASSCLGSSYGRAESLEGSLPRALPSIIEARAGREPIRVWGSRYNGDST